ncbi:tail fiber protein [Fluviispira sanaruensis]|uniref:Phage tail collar domain-containing protein n=1 Tax=Fluviispira sanaruensis TaxID=2493639 RepID=A0A4P2VK34_FLUSA|nr:tail fiber protein [Fluviispira sanaruensis]BBH53576.1 hypothetical protein JCM31447_20200 [Fluviispira sanaruensis]
MRLKNMLFISAFSLSSTAFAQNDDASVAYILSLEDRIQKLEQDSISHNQPRIPVGTVLAFAGENIPDGYFLCDGRELTRAQYQHLYQVIGDNHGNGNGSTTFHIPDYRGLFLRGVGVDENIAPESALRLAMKPGGSTGAKVGSIQNDSDRLHSHSAGKLKNSASNLLISGNASPNNSSISGYTSDSGAHSHEFDDAYFSSRNGNGTNPKGASKSGEDGVPAHGYYERRENTDAGGSHVHSFSFNLPNYNLNFTQKTALPQIISGRTGVTGGKESRPKNANVNYIIKYR